MYVGKRSLDGFQVESWGTLTHNIDVRYHARKLLIMRCTCPVQIPDGKTQEERQLEN